MQRPTIREVVLSALRTAGKPLSVKEIFDLIIDKNLYHFNAKRPLEVVKTEIRRHCVGIDSKMSKQQKFFRVLDNGTYWINDSPSANKGS